MNQSDEEQALTAVDSDFFGELTLNEGLNLQSKKNQLRLNTKAINS